MVRARGGISRRGFVAGTGAAALAAVLPPAQCRTSGAPSEWLLSPEFDAWVASLMEVEHLPGLSLAIIDRGKILRTGAFGWASLEPQRPMTPETLINIASVTKTVTGAAVMQLWEQKKFQLDADVSTWLPFRLRNPAHPETPITIRQLLTHNSSIDDSSAYWSHYVCGDHPVPMGAWLRDYFSEGGALYDGKENFHAWAPGTHARYSNIGYAVLGHLVETVSGIPYEEYCITRIFEPLGMTRTRFRLAGMATELHARPYVYLSSTAGELPELRERSWVAPAAGGPDRVPLCLYSFVTSADGLVRTSAADLARFLLAFIHRGELDGHRILQPKTIAQILSDQRVTYSPSDGDHANDAQGLTWFRRKHLGPDAVWAHNGGDPGVCTLAAFRPRDGRGLVLLTNGSPDASVRRRVARAVFLGTTEPEA